MSSFQELVSFTLVIDDLVFSDGTTKMAVPGGGGPQCLFGYQLVRGQQARVGLASGVGRDLPDSCRDWLSSIDCDLSGLLLSPQLPTPRAWLLHEADGRRQLVWRCKECPQLYQQLQPPLEALPATYQQASCYHLVIDPGDPPLPLLQQLQQQAHANGGLLLVEPYIRCKAPLAPDQLRQLLTSCDVFSPTEPEAVSMLGPAPPEQLVQRLLAAGASVVALRRGPEGAMAQQRDSGISSSSKLVKVPAVPDLQVVDETGCGNAFCGAFLAALHHCKLPLLEATAWGCVAGSIMAEWRGVPDNPAGGTSVTPRQLQPLAQRRLQQLLALARE